MQCIRWPGALALGCAISAVAGQEPATARFQNLNGTFALELPADWRQLAPDEARRLRELLPADLHRTEPRQYYGVGPVQDWLGGTFTGVYLSVAEQAEEWPEEADVAGRIRAEWQRSGDASGDRHEVLGVTRTAVGPDRHPAIECRRRTVPADGGPEVASLDLYAGTGGRQVILSLRAPETEWARWEPRFRRWLGTLTFARRARGQPTLSDRLWTPLAAGGVVGLLFLWLYRRNRRRA